MKNKYNVQIKVPSLYKTYDVLLPVNKTIGETILVLNKGLKLLTKDSYSLNNGLYLYNAVDGEQYNLNDFIYSTDIKNGSILILC